MAIPIRYDRAAILHVHPHKKNARRHSREGGNPLGSSCENMVTSHRVGITHAIRLGLILSLSLLWFFANTGQSLACSCVRPGSPPKSWRSLPRSLLAGSSRSASSMTPMQRTTTLRLIQPRSNSKSTPFGRALTTKPFTLRPRDQRQAAAFTFDEGEEYIVYSRDGSTVSLCSRTALLENAAADLDELGQGRAPQSGSVGPTPEPPTTSSGSCTFSNDFGSATARRGVARHHGRPRLVRCAPTAPAVTAVGVFPYPPLDTVLRQDISQMVGRHSDGVGRGSSGVRAQLEDH